MKKRITEFIMSHKDEMIEDISKLIRINSEKMEACPGKPFGEGPAKALETALSIAAGYGFKTSECDGYVGCVDFGEGQRQLDILAHLDVVPVNAAGWTVTGPFEPKSSPQYRSIPSPLEIRLWLTPSQATVAQ